MIMETITTTSKINDNTATTAAPAKPKLTFQLHLIEYTLRCRCCRQEKLKGKPDDKKMNHFEAAPSHFSSFPTTAVLK